MDRRLNALVLVLCGASMLAACGSGGPATALPTQAPASHLTSLAPSTTPSSVTATSAPPPTPPTPTPSPSPSPTAEITYVPVPQPSLALPATGAPAIPANARLDYLPSACNSANQNESCAWLRVAWQETNPSGVTIRVYAVTSCLHPTTGSSPSNTCVVDGDALPTL